MKNRYEITGDTTILFIKYKGKTFEALIDTEDLPKVDQYPQTWRALRRKNRYYVGINIYENGKRKTVYLHKVIMNYFGELDIDHLNRDGLDNRKDKLRIVTRAQNNQNQLIEKNNSSGFRNVSWHKGHQKWRVMIQLNHENIHIGYFENISKAKKAAEKARKEHMPYCAV